MHNMKKNVANKSLRQSVNTVKSHDLTRTTQLMQQENINLKREKKFLNWKISVNTQTLFV